MTWLTFRRAASGSLDEMPGAARATAPGAALRRKRTGVILAMLAATWIACGGGATATQPATSTAPVDDASASFTLRGAGYGETRLTYSSASGGLVFCRRQSSPANTLWVRLAADRAAEGANAPHVDLDLCNFTGSAIYRTVHDVTAGLRCAQGATWDLWWHDGPAKVFVSRPASTNCEVTLTSTGSALQGSFQCQGLTATDGGGDNLDVLGGSFRCTVSGP